MSEATDKDLLSQCEIERRLAEIEGWSHDPERSSISRRLVFSDFKSAFAFMTRIADKAEELGHHPEWFNVWNRVDLVLITHSAGGVTSRDFELARAVDEAAAKFPLLCVMDGESCGGCV